MEGAEYNLRPLLVYGMRYRNITAVVLTLIQAVALADPVTECRERYAESPQEHIACLEAALTIRDHSPAAEINASEASPEPQTMPEPRTSPELQDSPDRQASTESRALPEPETTPAPVSGLGAEQVRDLQTTDDSEPEEVEVSILSSTYNALGIGTFRMADGQVWRETMASPERKRLKPDREYKARIKRSIVGGYRMHVEGVRWMMTVERIQ